MEIGHIFKYNWFSMSNVYFALFFPGNLSILLAKSIKQWWSMIDLFLFVLVVHETCVLKTVSWFFQLYRIDSLRQYFTQPHHLLYNVLIFTRGHPIPAPPSWPHWTESDSNHRLPEGFNLAGLWYCVVMRFRCAPKNCLDLSLPPSSFVTSAFQKTFTNTTFKRSTKERTSS